MPRINEVDRRVLGGLSGSEKIKALLAERGSSVKEFARTHGEWIEAVSACIRGVRPLSEIRDKLAADLGLPRAEIDRLIDDQPTEKVG